MSKEFEKAVLGYRDRLNELLNPFAIKVEASLEVSPYPVAVGRRMLTAFFRFSQHYDTPEGRQEIRHVKAIDEYEFERLRYGFSDHEDKWPMRTAHEVLMETLKILAGMTRKPESIPAGAP